MPAVARGQSRDTVSTQHGCASTTRTSGGSNNVFVNGIGVHREQDLNMNHSIPCGDSCCKHAERLTKGSNNVIVNGKGIARVGDKYNNCGIVLSGSENVYAN
tara:strand:+ start:341 stop:646 length:306 start_codon:yes stop_codon:yes gene_type:complete